MGPNYLFTAPEGALVPGKSVIETLIDNNSELWDQFINNRFCMEGFTRSGSEFNKIFISYYLQDFHFLLGYASGRPYKYLEYEPALGADMTAGTRMNILKDMHKDFAKGLRYAEAMVKNHANMGLTESQFYNVLPCELIVEWNLWQQELARTEDIFTNHVRRLACNYGWYKIAENLQTKYGERVNKNTCFYHAWFVECIGNKDAAYDLIKTLDIKRSGYENEDDWAIWNRVFKESLQFEIKFFDLALKRELIPFIPPPN
ncbi:hypothetical protein EDC01DRAFT_627869 [Geopyxis carbonaria]|nr:hypothetical protein EDC01DRAFT_627869 [Geopyxis carbonaria]